MFRTARGFLLVAPLAFLVALGSFLFSHPRAAEAYTVYPFLVDALGPQVVRKPPQRFAATSSLVFLLPYLTTAILLVLADLGASGFARLWLGRPSRPAERRGLPWESVASLLLVTLGLSAFAGLSLHGVAHGGELPGGVNVAPVFVAAVPFAALPVGLLAAAVAAIPRAVYSRFAGRGDPAHSSV